MFSNNTNYKQITKTNYEKCVYEIRKYYAKRKFSYVKEFFACFYPHLKYDENPRTRTNFEQFMLGRSYKRVPQFMEKLQMMFYYHVNYLFNDEEETRKKSKETP